MKNVTITIWIAHGDLSFFLENLKTIDRLLLDQVHKYTWNTKMVGISDVQTSNFIQVNLGVELWAKLQISLRANKHILHK